MKIIAVSMAVTVSTALIVRAAPILLERRSLWERSSQPEASTAPMGISVLQGRVADNDVAPAKRDTVQTGAFAGNSIAEAPLYSSKPELLGARGPRDVANKVTDLGKTTEDVTMPLLASSELTGSLSDLTSHVGKALNSKGKHLVADTSLGGPIGSVTGELSISRFRTGQRELAEAQIKARKAVASAQKALELSDAHVVLWTKLGAEASSYVSLIREKLLDALGTNAEYYFRSELTRAQRHQKWVGETLDAAKTAHMTRTKELEDAEAEAIEKATIAPSQ